MKTIEPQNYEFFKGTEMGVERKEEIISVKMLTIGSSIAFEGKHFD